MIKSLDLLLGEGEKKSLTPVNLEALCPTGSKPSTMSIHYLTRNKRNLNGITVVCEFDCYKLELKRVGRYEGSFQDKDFRWSKKLGESFSEEIKEKERISAYTLVGRIVKQLKKEHQRARSVNERDDYNFFIGVLKKINADYNEKTSEPENLDLFNDNY